MFARFISDGKRKHPTFSFSDIRSRMFARFISDAKREWRKDSAPYDAKINVGCLLLRPKLITVLEMSI